MRIKRIVTALCWLLCATAHAFTVFACEPEWASLTHALLPQAKVHVATTVMQDPHHIEARPALIAQLRSAQLAVCTGASLEAGWLPMLQQRASNPLVQDGQPGMFYASQHVELIDPYQGTITPFDGDVHGEGNPHIQTDPHRLLKVALALRTRLVQLVPEQAKDIDTRHKQFEAALKSKLSEWEKRAAPLKGKQVVAHHTSFAYLWRWLGMQQVADLEPKPGMPATLNHLEKTRQALKAQPPMAIVVAQHQDARAGKWLEKQLSPHTPLLILPATVSDDRPDALLRWLDQLVQSLVQSLVQTAPQG